ncbi:hypothetical protein AAVH_42642 [Aphelenchoides avenae]|nr:hypothetical protein AAVH_42642 [Aphelenchus avenae]
MEYAKAVGVSFTLVGQLLAFLFSTEALPMSLQNIWLDLIVPFEQSPLSGDALAQAVVCFLETQFKRRLESDLISLGTTIIKRLIDLTARYSSVLSFEISIDFLYSSMKSVSVCLPFDITTEGVAGDYTKRDDRDVTRISFNEIKV